MSDKPHVADKDWWRSAVFYQIYPRSFLDTNDDGLGDLPGITRRIEYLRDLGVDALWISPFYPSPMKDAGYDISDYCNIDPAFGTLDDFRELVERAHSQGIRIIVDLVTNHTSDQHPWFTEARQSRDAGKHDWYIWHPGKKRRVLKFLKPRRPNNWISQFELRSAWWWNDKTKEYYLGTFTRHQPELNWRNDALKDSGFDVMRFWLDLGVDGFRIDVINWFIKDDRFRSNPFKLNVTPDLFQYHIYDRNRPETLELTKEFRTITSAAGGSERILVGEVFTKDPAIAAAYHGEDKLHMAFNFEFLYNPWKATEFYAAIKRWYDLLPDGAWPNFTLSNHDQRRHYSRYATGNETDARARVAAALLLTLRGTPFLYYGEEIGMSDLDVKRRDLVDPLGRKTWPLKSHGRDPERTPMQWTSEPNAGFTSKGVRPWLPINPNHTTKNATEQAADEGSLHSYYKKLIATRKEHASLRDGELVFVEHGENDVLSYVRTSGVESCAVWLNFGNSPRVVIPGEAGGHRRVVFGTHRLRDDALTDDRLLLEPYEVLIARVEPSD
ncbi:MAG: alpha-glucosidase [Spirochaetaceae bacterium]|nr:MAG: alpha-glucosidase [Spirochaetaceae bacterium]